MRLLDTGPNAPVLQWVAPGKTQLLTCSPSPAAMAVGQDSALLRAGDSPDTSCPWGGKQT